MLSKLFQPFILFVALIIGEFSTLAQNSPVNVTDQTLKIGAGQTESLFYGFAAGDEIVFSFEETDGKPLKVIEIIELTENKKFSEFKSSSIAEKRIKVYQNSVFEFRFANEALVGRICKIKIDRIPISADLASFNTDWKWLTVYDTTYTPYKKDSLTGYDTLFYKETTKDLIKEELVEDMFIDRSERVHTFMNSNGDKKSVTIPFPTLRNEEFFKEQITCWAYWIGVGEESNQAYRENVKMYAGAASKVASLLFSPLAGVAVGVLTHLILPTNGDNVFYRFYESYAKLQPFMNDETSYPFVKGEGVAAYGKNDQILSGPIYLGLYNDNSIDAIDVNIKIVFIKEQKTYANVEHDRMKITPRYVVLNQVKINVTSKKVRVNA